MLPSALLNTEINSARIKLRAPGFSRSAIVFVLNVLGVSTTMYLLLRYFIGDQPHGVVPGPGDVHGRPRPGMLYDYFAGREAIDPVRGITNTSSGKMGFAIAQAAAEAGAAVTLVAGPTALPSPANVERVDVVSAADMASAVLERAEIGRAHV